VLIGPREERVKQFGVRVDERENPGKCAELKRMVAQRLCQFWSVEKDIQSAVV
jgi:hypothetical protein